ncbi:MAG: potassium-transporting ATPase subunit KdpA [Candidatus Brocadia carolinensis]|uniref:Potassium-transporting ATPase potassium-binding subunit n=1 Tax=Candidatus Brocadia carolinensis TaxID=1004156 RepID=A0A1V4AVB4_9BACT|nr:MAG: potassium-transporting ATPase subunit KdpA [Candidatus Brocadia caroliniensis]
MNWNNVIQGFIFLATVILLAKPLGTYMARVYEGKPTGLHVVLGPVERWIYRLSGIYPETGMSWKGYAVAMMLFNGIGIAVVYALQRLQAYLPLNPMSMPGVAPDLAFNTAISFATNTNWQSYGGETTLSYLTQMAGLTTQNFVSAASGMAVLVALIRGFIQKKAETIGNFWVDLVRSTLYILLPLSMILAIFLVSQGVVQTFKPYEKVTLLQPVMDSNGASVQEQVLALGPAASQVAIKQLGTNGGGFFNVNSAHPFENPTPVSNFLEVIAIILIPAALCYTFGYMVRDKRQGWALLAVMLIIFIPCLWSCIFFEQQGNPLLSSLGIDQKATAFQPGGNMEGKEARFGIANSAIWAVTTTAVSNGSVNSMHDSYTPLRGLIPVWLMQLGEVVFGGAGSGLYGMIAFAIIAVFIAGLMIGRTPEYLGKKIEAFEMKMASLMILIPPALVLAGTAVAVILPQAKASIFNPGPHGFSEVLYAFSSAANNNGSAFGGLSANTPFYNIALGLAMFFARYWLAIPMLAVAGSLSRKKIVPVSQGTLPTHTPLFIIFLAMVVLIVGALTFFPALVLGPIVEHFMLHHR